MSKLLIEQLTEQVELNKTAEEVEFEKIAHVANVVDQAQTLSLVGEELYKIAEELENEDFAALAADIYQTGERMGACLSKTASDSPAALEEAMEIAEDLNKLASVIAEIADEAKDENFNKLAEAVIAISNEMTDDANEVLESLEKEADEEEVEKEAGARTDAVKKAFGKGWEHVSHGAHATKESFKAPEWKEKISPLIEHSKATHKGEGYLKSLHRVMKLAPKATAKAAAKAAAPYAGTAAALSAAGYGAKKHHDKKK